MFDRIAVGVRDLEASAQFFLEALAPLHARVVMKEQRAVALGRGAIPELWLDAKLIPSPPLHLAFAATNRRQRCGCTAVRTSACNLPPSSTDTATSASARAPGWPAGPGDDGARRRRAVLV